MFGYPNETLSLMFDLLQKTWETGSDHISTHVEESLTAIEVFGTGVDTKFFRGGG